jgi:Family of unknown function (DUF6069)
MTRRTRRRIATVVFAPTAALSAWALIRLVGVDLVVSTGDSTVGPADVFAASLVGSLGGWLVARLLERHSRSPRALWAFVGSTTLALSMIGPAWLADGASALGLMSLHLVTGGVVIGGFAVTLPWRANSAENARQSLRPTGDPAR